MALIDEEGNLLGVVNVIDALAVLLVVSLVVAGISVLQSPASAPGEATPTASPTPSPTPTASPTPTPRPSEDAVRYVTLEVGRLPTYVAAGISQGDVVRQRGNRTVTVTDTYTAPARDGRTWTTVRAKVDGRLIGRSANRTYRFGDSDLVPGTSFAIATADYRIGGQVTAVDESGARLATRTVTVEAVLDRADPAVADALDPGMVGRSTGATYVEVTGVDVAPATMIVTTSEGTVYVRDHPELKTVTLELELLVRETPAGLTVQGDRLHVGSAVHLDLGTVVTDVTVTDIRDGPDAE